MPRKLPDFLQADSHGDIWLAGHRVGLHHVVKLYNSGYSLEMIGMEYDALPLSLIHKTIAFYLDNQSEVDVYVAEFDSQLQAQAASAASGPDLSKLRERVARMKQANPS